MGGKIFSSGIAMVTVCTIIMYLYNWKRDLPVENNFQKEIINFVRFINITVHDFLPGAPKLCDAFE